MTPDDKIDAWEANEEMIDGYRDGFDMDCPEPSGNRSASYRHGFLNGRDDRRGKPRASYAELNRQGLAAVIADRPWRTIN